MEPRERGNEVDEEGQEGQKHREEKEEEQADRPGEDHHPGHHLSPENKGERTVDVVPLGFTVRLDCWVRPLKYKTSKLADPSKAITPATSPISGERG